MNEVTINTIEIESIWEKDSICFVKMKSGKVWLCKEFITNSIDGYTIPKDMQLRTKDLLTARGQKPYLVRLQLTSKGKSD